MINRTVALICITAIVLSIVGLIGWTSYSGGDVERILGWSGTTLGPLLGGLAAAVGLRHVNQNVESAKKDIQIVKVQTNGKMKRIGDRLDALEKQEREGQP